MLLRFLFHKIRGYPVPNESFFPLLTTITLIVPVRYSFDFLVRTFIKGYEEGVWQAVVSAKDSVVGLVKDPVGTATGMWDTVSNLKESFNNLHHNLEDTYHQMKEASRKTRGQLVGNHVMSAFLDKRVGKVLKITPDSKASRSRILRKRNNLLRGREMLVNLERVELEILAI